MNMERWRWMPADLGPLYVWGNTPEFMLYVVKDEKAIFADKTQVGTATDPTPVFSTDMTTIVFNILDANGNGGSLIPAASVSVHTTKGISFCKKSPSTTSLYLGRIPA